MWQFLYIYQLILVGSDGDKNCLREDERFVMLFGSITAEEWLGVTLQHESHSRLVFVHRIQYDLQPQYTQRTTLRYFMLNFNYLAQKLYTTKQCCIYLCMAVLISNIIWYWYRQKNKVTADYGRRACQWFHTASSMQLLKQSRITVYTVQHTCRALSVVNKNVQINLYQ